MTFEWPAAGPPTAPTAAGTRRATCSLAPSSWASTPRVACVARGACCSVCAMARRWIVGDVAHTSPAERMRPIVRGPLPEGVVRRRAAPGGDCAGCAEQACGDHTDRPAHHPRPRGRRRRSGARAILRAWRRSLAMRAPRCGSNGCPAAAARGVAGGGVAREPDARLWRDSIHNRVQVSARVLCSCTGDSTCARASRGRGDRGSLALRPRPRRDRPPMPCGSWCRPWEVCGGNGRTHAAGLPRRSLRGGGVPNVLPSVAPTPLSGGCGRSRQ